MPTYVKAGLVALIVGAVAIAAYKFTAGKVS